MADSPVTFTPPDTGPLQRKLEALPQVMRVRLLTVLRPWMRSLKRLAQADVRSKTGKWAKKDKHPGRLASSVRTSVRMSKRDLRLRLFYSMAIAFWAPWVNFGLVPRPKGERAVDRKGRISRRIGKARKSKPWGIAARQFLDGPLARMRSEFRPLVAQGIDDVLRDWNGR